MAWSNACHNFGRLAFSLYCFMTPPPSTPHVIHWKEKEVKAKILSLKIFFGQAITEIARKI